MKLLTSMAPAVLAASILSGCESHYDVTGKGPLTLSERQAVGFERWQSSTYPGSLFFIAGEDDYYSVVCRSVHVSQCQSNVDEWHYNCEQRYGKGNCKLYGFYGEVIWNFDDKPESQPATPVKATGSKRQ